MNYLEKLLAGVTMEWKPLGEVSEYVRGLTYNKSNESGNNTGYKVIRANNITLSRHTINFDNIKHIKSDTKVKESQKLFKNDILISAASGSREHVGKVAYIFSDLDYYFGGFMGVVRCSEQIKPRFLFHILTSGIFQKYLDEMLNSSTINNLSSSVMNSFQIPVPPLEVQKEIVSILDSFSELTAKLTAELTAELIARKKQYNYYLNELFNFDVGEVEMKKLNEIGGFQRGKRFVKDDMILEGVPCIHYGEMYTHYGTWANVSKSFLGKELVEIKKLRVAEKGDVVIVAAGETIEDLGKGTAWLGDEGVVIHDACFSYKSSLNTKYFAYFTRTKQYHDQIKKNISSGKISAIHSKGLSNVIIPVPSAEEQERIVTILDKFEIVTNSISQGLQKEIELRKKQYEYYRELLLTFPKNNLED